MRSVRVCIVGVGSVAANFVESLAYYRVSGDDSGMIFQEIFGYSVNDISVVCGFDIAANKVGMHISDAIYAHQNIFVRNPLLRDSGLRDDTLRDVAPGIVYRGVLQDNTEYLDLLENMGVGAVFAKDPSEIVDVLVDNRVDVVVNLLPTGSEKTSRAYAMAALEAGAAYINGTPATVFRDDSIRRSFLQASVPIFGDDLKSQVGTTLLHRSILSGLSMRGAEISHTMQINIGGNMDFLNLESKSSSKIASKKYSLSLYVDPSRTYVRNIYNPGMGPIKNAYIEIAAKVFGGSPLKISIKLESDDKANAAGCLADLVRFAKGVRERDMVSEEILGLVSAFYMKSPHKQMPEFDVFHRLQDLLSSETEG